jgi:16S rRNA (adenine1518-N6/adenine1519-N6)-dimethyltransferase
MFPTDAQPEKFEHKKSLGQNFLTSDVVPGWMCDAGTVSPGDIVLEIGPGTGALTRVLLARGATVHAVETDDRALLVLTTTFADAITSGRLTLHRGDVRDYDLAGLVADFGTYKIIANIPYYVSGFLLRTCLELPHPPSVLVFLMQKEVVARITRDKKQSLLSLSVAVYGEPRYYKTVSRGHFNPPPKVDSAILAVTNISHDAVPNATDRDAFFHLLHLGLGQRRKQLVGNLSTFYTRQVIEGAFATLSIKPHVRGEDLNLDTWLRLFRHLKLATPHMHR